MRFLSATATLVVMSEPSQPPVPPPAPSNAASPPVPPAAHLPATPQYPTTPQYASAPQNPSAPQAYPTAVPAPAMYPGSGPDSPHPPAAPGFPGHLAPPVQPRTGNPLGVAAFVIAAATLAINLFASLARPFVYGGAGGFEFMLALDNGIGILSFFAYVVALVLGVIAVRRAESRLITGIAIGVAGAGAIGLAFTGLTIALYQYL